MYRRTYERLCFGGLARVSVSREGTDVVDPEEDVMTKTEPKAKPDNASRVIESIQDLEQSTLEAVRKFVDTVDGQFPDLREDGPRRKIIDSAFKMVEQMVNASNKMAQNVVSVTENALAEFDKEASSRKN